jgi:hypothetical protein
MGLDIFAMKFAPAPAEDFKDINLCGGVFSTGDSSFRGKVYNSFIEWVTGDEQTLYKESIDFDSVKEIRNQLALFFVENKDADKAQDLLDEIHNNGQIDYPIKVDEVRNLLKFFDVCVEKGYTLHGWW